MVSEKISTKTLREKVYGRLKQMIISAEFLPGQEMTMSGLAKMFGVSLMPVREALYQLESEKAVVIESNRGIHVNQLTPREMEEVLSLRLILESLAAEKACEQRPDVCLRTIEKCLLMMGKSLNKHKRYVKLNSRFHFDIYYYSDSPILLQIINLLWFRIGPYIYVAAAKDGIRGTSFKCHQGMYQALVERDKEKMTKYLSEDLKTAAKLIIPMLGKKDFLNRTILDERLKRREKENGTVSN